MTSPDTPLTLTVRTTEDLLAVVPVVLGFTPSDSVAMLTFGAPRAFHARIDLPPPGAPPGGEEVAELVESLLDPARRHRVRGVALVLYTADVRLARTVARALRQGFESAAVTVVDLVRTHDERWWPAQGPRSGSPALGVAYDNISHPFTLRSVLEGRVVLPSRDTLVAGLRPLPDVVEAVRVARRALPERAGCPLGCPRGCEAESAWVGGLVSAQVVAGTVPSVEEVARLSTALGCLEVRDAACALGPPECGQGVEGRRLVDWWSEVVRRTPPEAVAPAASLLALAAWHCGHGALAWCAVDVARASAPDYRLAALVAALLEGAVPPGPWPGSAASASGPLPRCG